jgi:hypothetical protein
MTPATRAPFAAAHRMGHWVHGYTSNVWATTTVPSLAGFAYANILMVQITKLANSGSTLQLNHTQLAGRYG